MWRVGGVWLCCACGFTPRASDDGGVRDGVILDAGGPVTFVIAANASTSNSSQLSYPLAVPPGDARFLLVSVEIGSSCTGTAATVTSITYNGVALMPITSIVGTPCGTNSRSEQWQLVAPAVGTANVAVTLSKTGLSVHSGALELTGVNQAMPVRASASMSGAGNASSLAVASIDGDLVINTVGQGNGISGPGTSQTTIYIRNSSASSTLDNTAASTSPGAAMVTSTWKFTNADEWQTISSSIRP